MDYLFTYLGVILLNFLPQAYFTSFVVLVGAQGQLYTKSFGFLALNKISDPKEEFRFELDLFETFKLSCGFPIALDPLLVCSILHLWHFNNLLLSLFLLLCTNIVLRSLLISNDDCFKGIELVLCPKRFLFRTRPFSWDILLSKLFEQIDVI